MNEALLVDASSQDVMTSVQPFILLVEAPAMPVALVTDAPFALVVEPEQCPGVLVAAGQQGPSGPPGITGDDAVFAEQVDFVGETLIYRGYAAAGAPTSSAAWRIKRLTVGIDGDVSTQWAGGTAEFDKVWDDRIGLVYS